MQRRSDIIAAIKAGDEGVLDDIYREYRPAFVKWAVQLTGGREEDALDIFQEAIILLYENILQGRLTELSSSLKTYLFAIGKNRMLNQVKRESRKVGEIDVVAQRLQADGLPHDDLLENESVRQVAALVAGLGAPCDQLLKLFYYQRFSMEAIAENLGYSGPDVAKAQKNRCMKKLKEMAAPILRR